MTSIKNSYNDLVFLALVIVQILLSTYEVKAQFSVVPKIGFTTDFISPNEEDPFLRINTNTHYATPLYTLSIRYNLNMSVFMAIEGGFSMHSRTTSIENIDILDPITRARYNCWELIYSTGYSLDNGLYFKGGLGLTIVDTRKLHARYYGWYKDESLSDSNIIGIKFDTGYEFRKWIINAGIFFPVKSFSTSSLISDRKAISITFGRIFGLD